MKKLIVLDLDGTILNDDMKLSQELIFEIGKIKKENKVIIATGRSVSDAFRYYTKLKLDTHLICYNGGYIWNPITNHIVKEFYQESWNKLIDYLLFNLERFQIRNLVLSLKETTYIYNVKENPYLWGMMLDENLPCYTLSKELSTDPKQAHRIIIAVMPQKLNEIKKEITDNFGDIDIFSWKGRNDIIDISLKNVEKWEAIMNVAVEYNIQTENIISFGDARNDKHMLINSGIGIAMKNAAPDVKNAADHVTEFSNNEDGVCIFMKQNKEFFK